MHVLVTGGASFIGSWSVEALVAAGHAVMAYDSFVTGHAEYLGRVQGRGPVLRGDVRQALALQRAVRRFQPHVIVHLAACVSVPLSLQCALRSHDENTRGTLAVLEAARANKVRRVVFASSAAVYGRNPAVPLSEDTTLAPLSPYALHKLIAEQYARLHSELYGLETVALRYFNVYGRARTQPLPTAGSSRVLPKPPEREDPWRLLGTAPKRVILSSSVTWRASTWLRQLPRHAAITLLTWGRVAKPRS